MNDQPVPRPKRNGEIDTLRCFAMFMVVAMHTGLNPAGWIGVWIFYVISGFVVTQSLSRGEDGSARRWLQTFYAKRAARIIPIYALYVLVGAGVVWFLVGSPPWKALASLLLFYNNFAMIGGFGEMHPWAGGYLWTISVEMQFYAVFGLLFVFLSRKALVRTLIAFVVLSPLARAVAGHFAPSLMHSDLAAAYAIYATSFLHFDAFGAGALLALAWPELRENRRAIERLFLVGTSVFVLYLLSYFAVNAFVLGRHGIDIAKDVLSGILFGQGREIWLYSALTAVNCGIVAWTASGHAPWRAITRFRPLQWIGEVSYGAYIFHGLAILITELVLTRMIGGPLPFVLRPVVFVVSCALAIQAAGLSSVYIEKPCIRWMNARLKTRASRPAPNLAGQPSSETRTGRHWRGERVARFFKIRVCDQTVNCDDKDVCRRSHPRLQTPLDSPAPCRLGD